MVAILPLVEGYVDASWVAEEEEGVLFISVLAVDGVDSEDGHRLGGVCVGGIVEGVGYSDHWLIVLEGIHQGSLDLVASILAWSLGSKVSSGRHLVTLLLLQFVILIVDNIIHGVVVIVLLDLDVLGGCSDQEVEGFSWRAIDVS